MAFRLSGLSSGMDTESMIAELMKAQRLKSTKIEKKITKTEWTKDKWKSLNTKLYSLYTGSLSKLKMQGSFNVKKVSSSNENKATVTANISAPEGTHSLQIKQLASAQFLTGNQLTVDNDSNVITGTTKLTDLDFVANTANKITIDAGGTVQTLTISDTTTVDDFTKTLKDAGLNASYDTMQKRFFISSKESGLDNSFTISTEGTVDLSKLGLSTISKTDGIVSLAGSGTLVAPSDAIAIYNGAELTSSSNTLNVNGLTISLKEVTKGLDTPVTTDDETISFNVENNTQAVYDMVKDFVKSYNELTKEMNESYYAASIKGYEPLSDDEKEAMSESQIDKWEEKIKDSLLRRDTNLGTLQSIMRTKLSDIVEVDGTKYSLSSFGIGSLNYSEKGLLHIDGDSDDGLVAGLENKLMKALTEDPDKVMTVLNRIAEGLFSSMTEKMSSTSMRSALTFYNDKEMTKTITNYKDTLSELEKKLKKIEDRYNKQFSAMETAMSRLNSQSSSLASMLGTNQQ